MTLRLVALMSVVLLLCLGAFGLLINHYQDQLMVEVARTASEAGRAALRTLEVVEAPNPALYTDLTADRMTWTAVAGDVEELGDHTGVKLPPGVVAGLSGAGTTRIVRRITTTDSAGATTSLEDGFIMIQHVSADLPLEQIYLDCLDEASEGDGGEASPCETKIRTEARLDGDRFLISIEGVHAEVDSAEGLVLKVPRYAAENTFQASAVELDDGDTAAPGPLAEDAFEEVRFPLPVGDYSGLFQSIRDRSMFVMLGVFVVGTVLSAGVAARFTRPIRRLDAGLRRLSEGDLTVQVDPRGRDEVARLGRAFNEMTRSLRASRQRSRELVRREKLSALGRLAAGVAHDVRNPLHSIGLTLQHLRETCRPGEGQKATEFDQSMEIIRGEIRRLDQLVGNFLRFAKSDRRERRALDLRELLRETERLVRKEAEWRRIDVSLEIDETAPPVLGDGEAIRSSILNLVLNSFEAMPEGGRVGLALRAQEDEVVVEVEDSGPGIPEEDLDRVFEFAFSTREGGHGLGLAMVHQCVVEEHGGRIDLQSRPGDGTRVQLALPSGGTLPEEEEA